MSYARSLLILHVLLLNGLNKKKVQMTCRWSVGRRLSDVPLWVNIVPPVPKFADTMHLIGFNFHLIGYELVECLFVKSFDGLIRPAGTSLKLRRQVLESCLRSFQGQFARFSHAVDITKVLLPMRSVFWYLYPTIP